MLDKSFAYLKHQNEIQRGFENAFTSNFVEYITEPVDPIRALSEVKDKIETQKVQIQDRNKKIHDLKVQLKSQQEDLESRLTSLNKTVNDLRAQNQSLTNDLEIVNKTLEETKRALSREKPSHIVTMLEEAANFRNEVKKLTQENNKLKQQIYDAKKQADSLLEAEKRNIAADYYTAIKELKDQCDKYKKDVERMAAECSEGDKHYAMLQQDISRLRIEKNKLEIEVQSMKDKLDRERKLMETTMRAEKLNIESTCSVKLVEQMARAESDKRRIFALGTDIFKSFFNPNEQIDEKSFIALLNRVKNTTTHLQ